jgi:hypothetical protein
LQLNPFGKEAACNRRAFNSKAVNRYFPRNPL